MNVRPVNPAKPSGRSGAPPSAMVEAVCKELPFDRPDRSAARLAAVHRIIAAMFDNLPREVMAQEIKGCHWPNCPCKAADPCSTKLQLIDAAISAARAEVLGSAKGDA